VFDDYGCPAEPSAWEHPTGHRDAMDKNKLRQSILAEYNKFNARPARYTVTIAEKKCKGIDWLYRVEIGSHWTQATAKANAETKYQGGCPLGDGMFETVARKKFKGICDGKTKALVKVTMAKRSGKPKTHKSGVEIPMLWSNVVVTPSSELTSKGEGKGFLGIKTKSFANLGRAAGAIIGVSKVTETDLQKTMRVCTKLHSEEDGYVRYGVGNFRFALVSKSKSGQRNSKHTC